MAEAKNIAIGQTWTDGNRTVRVLRHGVVRATQESAVVVEPVGPCGRSNTIGLSSFVRRFKLTTESNQ